MYVENRSRRTRRLRVCASVLQKEEQHPPTTYLTWTLALWKSKERPLYAVIQLTHSPRTKRTSVLALAIPLPPNIAAAAPTIAKELISCPRLMARSSSPPIERCSRCF